MSSRTSHRRTAAGKKSRQEKNIFPAKKSSSVRFPDKNLDDVRRQVVADLLDEKIVTAFAACEKCFGYTMTVNGLCWSCTRGDAA